MGEEPRENPKLRMYKNIIQENEEGSSFIFWCIKYSYPFLKINRRKRNGNRRNKRISRKQKIYWIKK